MVPASEHCKAFGFTMNSHSPPWITHTKMYALTVQQGTLDKSMQQTAYIISTRETCVSAQLLPSVAGSRSTPGQLQNAPPKAFSATVIIDGTAQAGFTTGQPAPPQDSYLYGGLAFI